jgi:hypothetical protein
MTINKQHRLQKLALKRELRRNSSGKYALEASPLWKLRGPKKLATLLNMSPEEVHSVAKVPAYHHFDVPSKKPGKEPRHVQEPRELTLHLHYQFTKLLDRIIRPTFLHSATKKRSHVTNAEAHIGTDPVVCTDIQKFYENTTRAHVKAFLRVDLGWPIDLAGLMADALTVDGHLPTGSSVSPLLSYFTHRRLFAEIEQICLDKGCTVTLFVDDITVSGKHATMGLLHRIKRVLWRAGLVTHEDRSASTSSPVIITGTVREDTELKLRNKHRKSIVGLLNQLENGDLTIKDRDSLAAKISAAKCVDATGTTPFERKFSASKNKALHGITSKNFSFLTPPAMPDGGTSPLPT